MNVKLCVIIVVNSVLCACAATRPEVALQPSPESIPFGRAARLFVRAPRMDFKEGSVVGFYRRSGETPPNAILDSTGIRYVALHENTTYTWVTHCPFAWNPNPTTLAPRPGDLRDPIVLRCQGTIVHGVRDPNARPGTPRTESRTPLEGHPEGSALLARAWKTVSSPEPVPGFEAALPSYRAGRVGPELPESLRPHKVEAEAAVRATDYWRAIEAYESALQGAPWWPQGNFNVALLIAQQEFHGLAAQYMKRYLLLVPDAPNARQAQDKIYEWEAAVRR